MREPAVTGDRFDELCEAGRAAGLDLWLHERHPRALARAEGLHLTARGEPVSGRAFGQSCHDPGELDRAFDSGARYALLSPVFRPTSKPDDDREPIGVERLVRWAAGRAVYALGGVDPSRATALAGAGAHGMAVLGGIFDQPNPAAAAKMVTTLLAAWSRVT